MRHELTKIISLLKSKKCDPIIVFSFGRRHALPFCLQHSWPACTSRARTLTLSRSAMLCTAKSICSRTP